jgi:hypothetical protein
VAVEAVASLAAAEAEVALPELQVVQVTTKAPVVAGLVELPELVRLAARLQPKVFSLATE